MIRRESLHLPGGLLMHSDGRNGLASALTARSLPNLLKSSGVILLRGFNHDVTAFSTLVQHCSRRVTVDPARRSSGQHTQLVDAGLDAVGLHLENGNAPLLPDVIWFYCEVPPARGSQTTVCDGEAVLPRLTPATAATFRERAIRYERVVPEAIWKRYLIHELDLRDDPSVVGDQHLARLEALSGGTSLQRLPDGSLRYRFRTHAVHRSRFSARPAFANSLLGPSWNYETPDIRFDDGTSIDEVLWDEISRATDTCTRTIDWQRGDVAIIDNTRFMHGRRAIEDPARVIHNAQSYL